MDVLTSLLLYLCAAVAIAGAVAAAVLPIARTLPLLAVAAGAAAAEALLGAAFAGLATAVTLGAAALLIGSLAPIPAESEGQPAWLAQAAALACAVLFVALAYAAYRGTHFPGQWPGGWTSVAADGRLLLDRDALATVAAMGALLAALAAGTTLAGGGRSR